MIKFKRIGLKHKTPRDPGYIFEDYHNGQLVVNINTNGILISGQFNSRYIPFDMIERLEIEYNDGGMIIINQPYLIPIVLDIFTPTIVGKINAEVKI